MQAKEGREELRLLGRRIRELREQRGFSQEGFAEEIELDRAYYGGVERGERNVAALNLIRIARGLKVPVGELFALMNGAKR
jgi:transcriptional regulator with XRE-family HTH domain